MLVNNKNKTYHSTTKLSIQSGIQHLVMQLIHLMIHYLVRLNFAFLASKVFYFWLFLYLHKIIIQFQRQNHFKKPCNFPLSSILSGSAYCLDSRITETQKEKTPRGYCVVTLESRCCDAPGSSQRKISFCCFFQGNWWKITAELCSLCWRR